MEALNEALKDLGGDAAVADKTAELNTERTNPVSSANFNMENKNAVVFKKDSYSQLLEDFAREVKLGLKPKEEVQLLIGYKSPERRLLEENLKLVNSLLIQLQNTKSDARFGNAGKAFQQSSALCSQIKLATNTDGTNPVETRGCSRIKS